MKTFFTAALFAWGTFASLSAQTLEHYFNQKEVSRFYTPGIGAKYSYYDMDTKKLVWLNPDFSVYKNINLPGLPFGVTSVSHGTPSKNQFNDDTLTEFLLSFATSSTFSYRIMNENGEILFGDVNSSIYSIEINGTRKILVDKQVYTLPGFTLEHTFLNPVTFILLEDGVAKYVENQLDNLTLYNDDYTIWKTLPTPPEPGCPYAYRYGFSEKFFNDSDDLEFIEVKNCTVNSNSFNILEVVNEGADILFADSAIGYNYDIFFPAYLTGLSGNRFGVERNDTLNIYTVPGFTFEKSLPHVSYTTLDQSGFKYVDSNFPSDAAGSLQLYNADYSPWKTVFKQAGYSYQFLNFSEKIVDNDPGVEILGRYNTVSTQEDGMRIIREDVWVVFSADEPDYCHFSRLPGYPNKMICHRIDEANPQIRDAWVYALPTTTVPVTETPGLSFFVKAAPNPFTHHFEIRTEGLSNTWEAQIRVSSVLGAPMPFIRYDEAQTIGIYNTAAWPAGMYIADIRVGKERTNLKLIKK